MSKIDDGGPAFPWGDGIYGGLTKRDWFAGQALAGLTANPHFPGNAQDLAEWCYSLADAMLAEGRKRGGE